ncbi:hypothetical protein KBC75_03400 [Candidatus Shapirobacteria bacterium]|nr:hypothetical protein [Candidatus Shapirobacteria bacterium]
MFENLAGFILPVFYKDGEWTSIRVERVNIPIEGEINVDNILKGDINLRKIYKSARVSTVTSTEKGLLVRAVKGKEIRVVGPGEDMVAESARAVTIRHIGVVACNTFEFNGELGLWIVRSKT